MNTLSEPAKLFLKNNPGKKVVFTNGCFDILHSGHVQYLNHAKKLGEILFVGLNSDKSVKALKGEERPLNQEGDRKYILENLKAVDFVEIFDEETPYNLIKEVMPDILVKGGDWQPKDIVGSDIVLSNNGQVMSLDFKDGYSTTGLINNIRGN